MLFKKLTQRKEGVSGSGKVPVSGQASSGLLPEELAGLPFRHQAGRETGRNPIVIGLTTCGFCRKAIGFLTDNHIAFSYLYADQVSPQQKRIIKEYILKTFNTSVTYPFLIYDRNQWIAGFLRIEWEELFTT